MPVFFRLLVACLLVTIGCATAPGSGRSPRPLPDESRDYLVRPSAPRAEAAAPASSPRPAAATGRSSRATTTSMPGWTRFRPNVGGFRCLVPGRARPFTERGRVVDGARFVKQGMAGVMGPGFYEASVQVIEGGIVGRIVDLREDETVVRQRNFASLETRRTEVYRSPEGYQVIDAIVDGVLASGEPYVVYHRSYRGRARIVRLVAAMPAGAATNPRQVRRARGFFDSLELDDDDASSPAGDGTPGPWRWYAPLEAGFAARFPGTPRYASTTFEHDERERRVHRYEIEGPEHRLWVRAYDFGERMGQDMVDLAQSAPVAEGFTMVEDRAWTRQGYGGRAMVFRKGDVRRILRLLVTPTHVYEIFVEGPAEVPAFDEVAFGFANSFRAL